MAIDYLDNPYRNKEVFHDMINKVLELVSLEKNTHIPHEWYFIDVLMDEIKREHSLADCFVMYIAQYYPKYRWIKFDGDDYLGTVILECSFYRFQFYKKCELQETDENISFMPEAMMFGDIVTDFLIRYCGYSLIKSSNQNIIITARNDCKKRFEDLLCNGYSLQRRQRVVYTDLSSLDLTFFPKVKGFFKKRPVIPTHDSYLKIDEIIELDDGQYQKLLSYDKSIKLGEK